MERESTQGAAGGRSSDEQPPAAGRGAGAAEIEDGAAVDAIAACIRPQGGESSGSADDRFAARIEGLVEAQREVATRAAEWAKGREPDAGKRTGLFVIESVRTQALLKIADLTEREEPVSTEELARLALTLYRIEDADRRRVAREQAAADIPARPAERKLPSHDELTAIFHKAVKEQFFPGRLGVPPWKDGWDAPRLPTPTPPRRTRRPGRVSTVPPGTGARRTKRDTRARRTIRVTSVERTMMETRETRAIMTMRPKRMTRTKRRIREMRETRMIPKTRVERRMWTTRAERMTWTTRAERAIRVILPTRTSHAITIGGRGEASFGPLKFRSTPRNGESQGDVRRSRACSARRRSRAVRASGLAHTHLTLSLSPLKGGEGWVRGRAWRRLDPAPATLQAREALSCGIPRCPAGFHLPLSPSQPVRFPQAAGAGFFISLRRRALAPLACLRATRAAQSRRPGCGPGGRRRDVGGAGYSPSPRVFISLRRRALAPLACLRAIRRGAQSRAPNLRSGPDLFISLRRRALVPLACLRAIRRGAQSRAPNLRSGTLHGGLLVGRGSRQRQGQDIPLYPGESHDGRGRSTMAGAGPARRTP